MTEPLNKAGRPIWFKPSGSADGTYQPVGGMGCMVMLAAVVWLLLCGAVAMIGFAFAPDGRWFVGMFVAAGLGLGVFAAIVIRHS